MQKKCFFHIRSKHFEKCFDASDCVQGLDDAYEKMHTKKLHFGLGVGDMTKILYHDMTNFISQ